jgi:hypothetical protein
MLSKFTMNFLQIPYEIKVLNVIFKNECVFWMKYDSDDTSSFSFVSSII